MDDGSVPVSGTVAPEGVVQVALESVQRELSPGMQVYASVGGRTVADFAVGSSGPGVLRPTTAVAWLSATKPVVAIALGRLRAAGRLELDDRVTRYVPEFAAEGKAEATIAHLLTHTVPFEHDVALDAVVGGWDAALDAACRARLLRGQRVGAAVRYTAFAAWQVLGEIVQRLADEPLGSHVRSTIFEPLGMACSSLGAAPLAPEPPERSEMLDRRAAAAATGSLVPYEVGVGLALPGMGGIGPMHELGRFYEALRSTESAAATLGVDPATLERMTTTQRRRRYDVRYGTEADWGLGFITDRRILGGSRLSRQVFGHDGRLCSVAFCDREIGLVACLMANALTDGWANARRLRGVIEAILDEVGTTGGRRVRSGARG